ncbi:hypothetical protein [Bosea sp. NBC_00550]|uniref:hypothetical protein n=1 Tax=Bosea sp. NBC_00550 TaxID=2969621 RepID=UPI002232C879|nr:hypothetical protein [Bosea sp. NBC_00550]UZF92687.1 hypothetical protein NWE53_00210 [Bosea sp. NBC_00550]
MTVEAPPPGALGPNQHEPTETTRSVVRAHAYNRVPKEIIARILRIGVEALEYHYKEELELTEYQFLALAARNILALANQTDDLGVALRANEMLLRTRSAHWREPKSIEAPTGQLPSTKVEHMTLEQVEAELARIGITAAGRRDEPAGPSPADPRS